MRERVSARPTIELRIKPGKASNFIHQFEKVVWPEMKIIPCCRVSRSTQAGNLADQDSNLRQAVAKFGGVIVEVDDDIRRHVGPGADPSWLVRVSLLAQTLGAGLLMESTDRFIRSPKYHGQRCPNAQAAQDDLELLHCCTDGVKLMTVLDPDAPPSDARSCHTIRGQQQKGRKGGRRKKRFQRDWPDETIAVALQLWQSGLSQRGVAKRLGVPVNTLRYWIARLQ